MIEWLAPAVPGWTAALVMAGVAIGLFVVVAGPGRDLEKTVGRAPETRIGCAPFQIHEYLARAGAGMGTYRAFLVIDLVWAVSYAILLPTAVGWASDELFGYERAANLVLLPFIAGVADVCENASLLVLTIGAQDEQRTSRRALAWIVSRLFTFPKFLGFYTAALIIAAGGLWWLVGAVS